MVGQRRIPGGLVVMLCGATVWLGIMIADTGTDGLTALWTAALYLVPLAIFATPTRTVSLWDVLLMFFAGGLMLGIAFVGIEGFELYEDDPGAASRDVVVPLIEETFKLVPILVFILVGRRGRTHGLGATDIILLGAAAGAGFGLVEDAYIRDRFGWNDQIDWLPLAEISGGRVIAGHAVWTTVAALGVGLALVLRSRKAVAVAAGLSGLAWVTFDHFANNYAAGHTGGTADTLENLTGDGWATIWLLVVGGIAAVGVDLWIQARSLPRIDELRAPAGLTANSWAFRLGRRSLAHAVYQYRHAESKQSEAGQSVLRLVGQLHDLKFPPPAPAPTAAPAPADLPAQGS
ncbi:MAG: hypothetical protein Kow0010_15320 [Dehalococcoidia bacterium]